MTRREAHSDMAVLLTTLAVGFVAYKGVRAVGNAISSRTALPPAGTEVGGPVQTFTPEPYCFRGFGDVEDEINEQNFPQSGPVADVADMLAVSQKDLGGSNMTTAEIVSAANRRGGRPATLAELLAYAKAEWNGEDRVAALGSWYCHKHCLDSGRLIDIRSVPCLYGGGNRPALKLQLAMFDYCWNVVYLFLVVRK